MHWKNMNMWKKKSKIWIHKQFSKDFSLFITQCYCMAWSVEENTGSKNPKVARTKNGKIMLLSKCAVCGRKKVEIYKRARS